MQTIKVGSTTFKMSGGRFVNDRGRFVPDPGTAMRKKATSQYDVARFGNSHFVLDKQGHILYDSAVPRPGLLKTWGAAAFEMLKRESHRRFQAALCLSNFVLGITNAAVGHYAIMGVDVLAVVMLSASLAAGCRKYLNIQNCALLAEDSQTNPQLVQMSPAATDSDPSPQTPGSPRRDHGMHLAA